MQGQTKSMYFQKILGLVRQKIVDKLIIQTDQNLPKNVFLLTTDKYSAVFTEYSVAEYSVGHYSAEYSADRIVGRSLLSPLVVVKPAHARTRGRDPFTISLLTGCPGEKLDLL
jgi:hypothetical protein